MARFDLETVDRLLSTTKAVRRRLDLDRPVPREVVIECLRLAAYAPNASNAQEWHWVVVDDAEQRAKLAAIYRRLLLPRVTQMKAAKERAGDVAGARISRSIIYLAEEMHRVPVLVLPCFDVAASIARYEVQLPEPGQYPIATKMDSSMFASILPAVWSFQLALRSRGLGTVLTTAHQLDQPAIAEVLNLPESWYQVALLPVAYTVGDDFKPSPRAPIEDTIVWNRFDGE